MLDVHEINDINDLNGFRPAWWQLLAETADASFFHSLQWLECYWKHFGAGQKLRVLVVTDRQRPVGILPLVVRQETTRVGRVRVLNYPLHDWATFYGPIGPDPAATLTAGLQHIRRTPRDWDVLDLRWIDADGGDLGRTERAMTAAGFRSCRQIWERTSLAELPDTWEEYWLGREPKFRRNIDRLQQRMAEQGKVELVRTGWSTGFSRNEVRSTGFSRNTSSLPPEGGTTSVRWDLYDTCVELAERSWQGDGRDRTNLCHGNFGDFFRAAHAAAADLAATDINLLFFDGHPAAFAYNYCWNGAVYGLRKGFDPRFAKLRPGLVLQKLMLEDGHRRGDRFYDLGTGNLPSKLPWRTSVRASYRFTFFPALVFRAQLLRWNRWLRQRLHGDRDIACST